MSTSSGDDDFSSAASLSAGEASDGCDCDDCFLGISDMMSSALRTVPLAKKLPSLLFSILLPAWELGKTRHAAIVATCRTIRACVPEEDVTTVPPSKIAKIASPDSTERVPAPPTAPRLPAEKVPALPEGLLDRLVLLPPPAPGKVAAAPPTARLGPWCPPPFATFASDPGPPPDVDLLKMSLRDYKKALAASRKNSSGGERTAPMTGYEMYRLSLLKQLAGAEYADASSDDLSSDWEEPDDGHKAKKVHVPPS
ncbi:hypothetical protein MTO96_027812 [Rhipicephalus appendiculatus]